MKPSRTTAAALLAFALACGGDASAPAHEPTSIEFAASNYLIALGGTATASVVDDRGTDITTNSALAWTSSDPAIASVDANGVVTGKTLGGPVTITATLDEHSAITVVRVLPRDVAITPAISEMEVGTTHQLTGVPIDFFGNPIAGLTIAWSSSDASIASVDPVTGFLLVHTAGSFAIYAAAGGKTTAMGVLAGVPTQYDGTFVSTPPGATVNLYVRFGRVRTASASVTPFPGCSFSTNATPDVPIVDNRFSFSIAGSPTSISGTFDGFDTIRGAVGTILIASLGCTINVGNGSSGTSGGPYTASRF